MQRYHLRANGFSLKTKREESLQPGSGWSRYYDLDPVTCEEKPFGPQLGVRQLNGGPIGLPDLTPASNWALIWVATLSSAYVQIWATHLRPSEFK